MTYRNQTNANFANIATVDANGNITAITVGNITTINTETVGNLITTNGVFWSNGASILTGITGTYSNANVTSFLSNSSVTTTIGNLQLQKYEESVYSLGTTSGTLAFNLANGSTQKVTINNNITITNSSFTNMVAGTSLTVIITISGSSNAVLSTSGIKYSNGGYSTISITSGLIDIIYYFYDGTTYYGSLIKGYQ